MSSPLEAAIQVAHQQTRFHIAENDQTREIDIRDLDIAIKQQVASQSASATKILAHAHLRIKTGIHYAFVGRNGSGKTTVVRSISQRLIPGLDPLNLRVASLEQRNDAEQLSQHSNSSVLDYVAHSDPHRRALQRQHHILATASSSSNPADIVSAFRKLQLEREQHELAMVEKEARLRSGARGWNTRAELRKHENKVEQLVGVVESLDLQSITPADAHKDGSEIAQAAQMMTELELQLEAMPLRELTAKATSILQGLGFTHDMMKQSFRTLSGGWQMRCLLAAALVQPADLLILDEPTNFLDMLGILWLQQHLIDLKESAPERSVLLITHDRQFVNDFCEELIILKDKQLVYFPGNLDSYDKSIYRERLRLTRMKEAQEKQVAHIKSSIADNIRQGKKHNDDGKLKQAKSRQKKLDDRMGMEVSAKGTRFKLNRDLGGYYLKSRADIEVPHEEPGVSMTFPIPNVVHPSGSLVSLEHVSLKYKSSPKPVFSDVNLVVHQGDRIGILGLNGAGKTTLVKVLTSTLPPSSGTVQTHPRLKIGYYSQLSVDVLSKQGKQDPQLTPLLLVMNKARSLGQDSDEQPLRALLSGMGLQGKTVSDTPIDKLSGGQLVRLAFALLLLDPPQLLVLDEPSTHLDVYTVTALARALREYEGAVVLVTHDRFFMRTVIEGGPIENTDSSDEDEVDNDITLEHRRRQLLVAADGKVRTCEGGVDAWEALLEKRIAKLSTD